MIGYLAANDGTIGWNGASSAGQMMAASGNNLGNLAFWYTTRRLFDASDIAYVTWSSKGLPSGIKCLVIPAANFIGPHANLAPLLEIVKTLDVPTLLIGVGAQSEREDQIPQTDDACTQFLREVEKRSPWIAVRGEYSAKVCRALGIKNIRVLGCPSILMNNHQCLGQIIEKKISNLYPESIAVHAACHKGELINVERELIRYVKLFSGSSYVIQRPVEMIKSAFRENTDLDKEYLSKLSAFFGENDVYSFSKFLQRCGYAPVSINSWASYLRRFSCSINTRIHGTIVSIQSGIPGLCIHHDTRTKELSDRLLLPALSTRQFIDSRYDLKRLFLLTKFDGRRFDEERKQIAQEYISLFEDVGLVPSRHLLAFADGRDAAKKGSRSVTATTM